MVSKSESKEPVNKQMVANMYGAMRSELNQIYSKITELEMEVSKHSLVINAIQPLDPSRRCYWMIGGVLVERTIKEVLPTMQQNKEGLEEVIARLNETLEKKKKEIADFETKYKIRIKKSDSNAKMKAAKRKVWLKEFLLALLVQASNRYIPSYFFPRMLEFACDKP